ncbi:MAG TPA: alpha/beta fold hydrolase [Sandaracinaceae bacterium]
MPTPEHAEREVVVRAHDAELPGTLTVPAGAPGVVAFAHGSGSSRHSPRNRFVARELSRAGLGTLLFDLMTPGEEALDLATGRLRFDIPFLARRVVGAIDWLKSEEGARRIGLFGASTGAAAALVAAAQRHDRVAAVVSRGGRPDLAGDALANVRAPTLLVVGSLDTAVIALNRQAMARMRAPVRLEIVEGAGHLFEEPGTLERVASLAVAFLRAQLAPELGARP